MPTDDGQSPDLPSALKSKPQPIQLLQTSNAFVYSQATVVLILAVVYASFSQVVADPVIWLAYLLIPLAISQAVFCCLCVPASSTSKPTVPTQSTAPGKTPQHQRNKKKLATWQATIKSRLIPAILSVVLSSTVTIPPLFVLAILHGAPFTTHHAETLLLAAHLSLLSCIPLFYAHGVSSARWRTLYSLQAPIDELMGAAIGTIIGAWIGAVPIPLDWDREWQRWPVTVVVGAYGGWAVGRTLGGSSWLKGKYIQFD